MKRKGQILLVDNESSEISVGEVFIFFQSYGRSLEVHIFSDESLASLFQINKEGFMVGT